MCSLCGYMMFCGLCVFIEHEGFVCIVCMLCVYSVCMCSCAVCVCDVYSVGGLCDMCHVSVV